METTERPVILAIDDEPGILESFALVFEPDYEVLRALQRSLAAKERAAPPLTGAYCPPGSSPTR